MKPHPPFFVVSYTNLKTWFLLVLCCYGVVCCNKSESTSDSSGVEIINFYPLEATTGDVLTIVGKNFGEKKNNVLKIGGVVVYPFYWTNDTIKVVITTTVQSGNVTLTINNFNITGTQKFRYVVTDIKDVFINYFYPLETGVGGYLKIRGRNFGNNLADINVQINRINQKILNVSDTQVWVQIQNGTSSGNITVVRRDGRFSVSGRALVLHNIEVSTFCGDGLEGFVQGSAQQSEFRNPYHLLFNKAGNLLVSDMNNASIRLIDANGNSSIYVGNGSIGNREGVGNAARVGMIAGLSIDSQDTLYASDVLNNVIYKIEPSGYLRFMSNGVTGFLDGIIFNASFNKPMGLFFYEAYRTLYVSDSANQRIRNIQLGQANTYAGNGTKGFVSGDLLNSSFNNPVSVAYSTKDNMMYIADAGNHCIRKIKNGQVSTFIGDGVAGYDNDKNHIRLNTPMYVICDASGNVYVADAGNHCIRKFNAQGENIYTIGMETELGMASGNTDNAGVLSSFHYPTGIAIDELGNLYIADNQNHTIRKIVIN